MLMEAQHDLDFSSTPCESLSGRAPAGRCSKTSLDCSAATGAETLLPWLEKWLGANLTFRQVAGKTPVLLSDRSGSSSGLLWTRNMSEWNHIPEQSLSDAGVCSLSEILETGPIDPRYFLSAKACAGILRRAEKRGKELPKTLLLALQAVAEVSSELVIPEGKTQ